MIFNIGALIGVLGVLAGMALPLIQLGEDASADEFSPLRLTGLIAGVGGPLVFWCLSRLGEILHKAALKDPVKRFADIISTGGAAFSLALWSLTIPATVLDAFTITRLFIGVVAAGVAILAAVRLGRLRQDPFFQ
jgi:hypothetical protein